MIVNASGDINHPLVESAADIDILLCALRQELEQQAAPVVNAIYEWSGFSRKGSWGMITSSWVSHFVTIFGRLGNQIDSLPIIQKLFEGGDEIARMKPRLHPVTQRNVTHVYQRRASCCRYYLLPQGDLCASCPLVSDDERIKRNVAWMDQNLRHEGR